MLGKLLKYEIPAVGRQLAPMYLAWLAASALLGLTLGRFDGSNGFMLIPAVVYFGVTVAVFVMAIVLIIQRYYNSLFGDEAYFNQSLPVTAGEHIMSKTMTALVWTYLTLLAAVLSGVIIMLFAGGSQAVWGDEAISWTAFWTEYSHDIQSARVILIIFEFLTVFVFSTLKSILAVYASITIGHLVRDHVVLASIGAYIGLMMFESMVGNIVISIGFLANRQVDMNTLPFSDFAMFQALMGISFIVCLALIAVYFFICKYFMEKKLNLA